MQTIIRSEAAWSRPVPDNVHEGFYGVMSVWYWGFRLVVVTFVGVMP
jgi:hypothetical protein